MAYADYFKSIRKDKHDTHDPSVRTIFSESVCIKKSTQLQSLCLTNSLWKTYRINALYEFSYDDEKFNEYQLCLSSYLKKVLSDNKTNLPIKFDKCAVRMKQLNSTAFAVGDHPGVQISIMNEDDDFRIPCFVGFLLSVERKIGFMERSRRAAQAVVLPLFLVDYADELFLNCVISFLKIRFHCHIWPLKFASSDLIWILALSSCPQDKECSATILEYELPITELSSIKYAIDAKTMNNLCQQILKPDSYTEISKKQVENFYSKLQNHFYSIFSINLSRLKLSVIKTPLARVQDDHSIIIFEKKYLFAILRHLTHLSQELR